MNSKTIIVVRKVRVFHWVQQPSDKFCHPQWRQHFYFLFYMQLTQNRYKPIKSKCWRIYVSASAIEVKVKKACHVKKFKDNTQSKN